MKSGLITLLLFTAMLLCSCGPSQHEQFFGHSVHRAIEQQAIERVPPRAEPVTGLDGQYGAQLMDEQRDPEKRRELAKEAATEGIPMTIIGGSQ
jgi:hypothetical protein